MRRRLGLKAQGGRRFPLPPDLRAGMKTALRKVAVDHAKGKAKIRANCREAIERAKQNRNAELAKLEEESGERAAAIRDEFDAKASERILKLKVEEGRQ